MKIYQLCHAFNQRANTNIAHMERLSASPFQSMSYLFISRLFLELDYTIMRIVTKDAVKCLAIPLLQILC